MLIENEAIKKIITRNLGSHFYGETQLIITFENGKTLTTSGQNIGTYRDDNVKKIINKIKKGMKVNVRDGEQGIAINLNPREERYYGPNTYILPDNTKII